MTENDTQNAEYVEYRLDMQVEIAVDPSIAPYVAPAGRVTGFVLPDGRRIKPWVIFEIEESADPDNDDYRNLTSEELSALGIHYDYREIEIVED